MTRSTFNSANTKEKRVMPDLEQLLDDYWNAAYAEGSEGRTHDTLDRTAQKALTAIRAYAAALERERDEADENNRKQAVLNAELLRDMARMEAGVKRIADALNEIDGLQNLGDARLVSIIKTARAECRDVKRPLL